jgi:hypothetical protein
VAESEDPHGGLWAIEADAAELNCLVDAAQTSATIRQRASARRPFALAPGGSIVLCGTTFSKSIQDTQPVVLVRFSSAGRLDRGFGMSIYAEQTPADRRPPLTHRKHVEAYHFEPQGLAVDGQGRIVMTGGETAPYTRGQQEAGYSSATAASSRLTRRARRAMPAPR